MVIKCEDVWREISNYLEGDLDPALKLAMEEHFAQCRQLQCGARWHARMSSRFMATKRMFTLPAGFHPRLRRRLADQVEGQRGSSRGWLVGFAATGALAALVLFRSRRTIASCRSLARR